MIILAQADLVPGGTGWMMPLVNLGGTVVAVALFLVYLYHKDQRAERREQLFKEQLEHVNQSAVTKIIDISTAFTQTVTQFHDDMRALTADSLTVGRDMVSAIAGMRVLLDRMNMKIESLDDIRNDLSRVRCLDEDRSLPIVPPPTRRAGRTPPPSGNEA